MLYEEWIMSTKASKTVQEEAPKTESPDPETHAESEESEKTEAEAVQESDTTSAPQDEPSASACEEELEQARAALAEAEEKVLRLHADFENSKKRLEKDKANAVAFANETFAGDLLSVLDSFESAFGALEQIDPADAAEAIAKIKEGMELTYNQMRTVLKKHGIEEVDHEGHFDPEVHQAVMQVESDAHESGEIVQVLQKGYRMKERTLRAAMVSTAK
jgi:molecular chaperone GrpE